jgi:hypothetical protein
MSDFPEGVIAPEGAQELVDVCKETWAVTQRQQSGGALMWAGVGGMVVLVLVLVLASSSAGDGSSSPPTRG